MSFVKTETMAELLYCIALDCKGVVNKVQVQKHKI